MSVYIGVNGEVRKVEQIKTGAGGGVKSLSEGYCSVGSVKRQFWGKPKGISHFRAGGLVLMGYKFNGSSWTDKTEITPGTFTEGTYTFSDFAALTKVSDQKFTFAVQPYRYGYICFNIYAVFDNGRTIRVDKLLETLGASMEIPAVFRFARIAGSGTWSGSLRIIGKTVVPSGFSSNTTYSATTTEITTPNAYTIYGLAYDRGNKNPITLELEIPYIQIDGTQYTFQLK